MAINEEARRYQLEKQLAEKQARIDAIKHELEARWKALEMVALKQTA